MFLHGELAGPHRVSWDEEGLITSIEPCALDEVETRGSILCPGFISLQVNGVDDVDVREAKSPEHWARLSQLLLAQGVTSWCPTFVSESLTAYPKMLEEVTKVMATQPRGSSEVLGAHLEGPFLGVPGAHPPANCIHADLEWVSSLPGCVRLLTLAPEQKNALEATRLLREKGIVVAVGHSKANEQEVEAFVKAGGSLTTHLFNAMPGVHHRNDGLALTSLTTDELFADIIVDLHHVSARAVELAFRAKPGKMILITDSIAHLSPFTKNYYFKGEQGSAFDMSSGAPRLRDGTLAGATVRMDQCVQNCVNKCNVPLAVALCAASGVCCRVLGLEDRGELARGKRADLVLLNRETLRVIHTVARGIVFESNNDTKNGGSSGGGRDRKSVV